MPLGAHGARIRAQLDALSARVRLEAPESPEAVPPAQTMAAVELPRRLKRAVERRQKDWRSVASTRDEAHHRACSRWQQRQLAAGYTPDAIPSGLDPELWGRCRATIASEPIARQTLELLGARYSPLVVARLKSLFEGERLTLLDERARKLVAALFFLYGVSSLVAYSRARNALRCAPCVRGRSRSLLGALLAVPFATRRDARGLSVTSVSTYLADLEATGLLQRYQPPADEALPFELGASGWPCNRYWLWSPLPSLAKPALELATDRALEIELGCQWLDAKCWLPGRRLRRQSNAPPS